MPLVKPDAYDHLAYGSATSDPLGQPFKVNDQTSLYQQQFGIVQPMPSDPYAQFKMAEGVSSDLEQLQVTMDAVAPADPYQQVKVMLKELCLEDLLEVFTSNVVRVGIIP